MTHLGDLKPDPANVRLHTPRSNGMLVDVLQAVGAARSIVIDEDDVVLAGNGVVAAAGEAGIERVRVIEADGNEIIAVRRTGLTDEQKKQLSVADNRASDLSSFDFPALDKQVRESGLDLASIGFNAEEFERLVSKAGVDADLAHFEAAAGDGGGAEGGAGAGADGESATLMIVGTPREVGSIRRVINDAKTKGGHETMATALLSLLVK